MMKANNEFLQTLLEMDGYELYTILEYYIQYFDMNVEPDEDWGHALERLFLQYVDAEKLEQFTRKFIATAFQRTDNETMRETLNTIIMGDGECEDCGGSGEVVEILQQTHATAEVVKECSICRNQWKDVLNKEYYE